MKFNRAVIFSALAGLLVGCSDVIEPETVSISQAKPEDYKGSGSLTQGIAKTTTPNIFTCDKGRSRVASIGEIKDSKGIVWTVPAKNNFASAPKAVNLYEECEGTTPQSIAEVDQSLVPVTVVEPDGAEITAYIFADNYFELYINGVLIAVDPVPFTPFNSSIVKFKVNKPYTIAVKVIDWEEHLGVGTENNRGKDYHPGDGGFIASFSDSTVTNANWRAQTFYTAPIYDLSCLNEKGNQRLSKNCTTEGKDEGKNAYAVHWQTPKNWMDVNFNASAWPKASLYTDDDIGVNNKKAYMNFIEKFSGAGAKFIWSTNIVLDNEVLFRYEVK